MRISFVRFIAPFLFVLALPGCATYKPVPEGYKGPTAWITDTGLREGGAKAQLFIVAEIDGNPIRNARDASAGASSGQGFGLTTSYVTREVPARPMKLKLVATHTTGAPIHAIFSQAAGTFLSVEGVVDFTPAPGGHYHVKGELRKGGSSVWIEDVRTKQPVTQKVTSK